MGCCGSAAPAFVAAREPPATLQAASSSQAAPDPSAPHGTLNHFLAETQRNRWEAVPIPLFKAYARYLGLDPEREPELLWLADFAMRAPLPVPWTSHFDAQGQIFYYNSELRVSSWIHPLEHDHRDIHRRIREFRSHGVHQGDVGLCGLREDLERLEGEFVEVERDWSEHYWSENSHRGGRAFFFNTQTRCSSWTDPRPAVRHRLQIRRQAVLFLLGYDRPECSLGGRLDAEPDRPAWLEAFAKDAAEQGAASQRSEPETWKEPRLLLVDAAAECPVCYDPLYRSQPSVLVSMEGQRICGHYYCYCCAQKLQRGCPLCRARTPGGCHAQSLPDVEKWPRHWFAMVDVDADGRLTQSEVVKALEAVLPLDGERLWTALGAASPAPESPPELRRCAAEQGWWVEWARSRGGEAGLGVEAFCEQGGMLQWIVENLGELRRIEAEGEPPELYGGALERWFDFWDSNADGGLSRAELLRALMKTLKVSSVERHRVSEIRETIQRSFSSWAADGCESVSRDDFLSKPGGLGELLLHSLFPAAPSLTGPQGAPVPQHSAPELLERPPLRRSGSAGFAMKLGTLRRLSEKQMEKCADSDTAQL